MQKGELILKDEYYILVDRNLKVQKQSDAGNFLDIADIKIS